MRKRGAGLGTALVSQPISDEEQQQHTVSVRFGGLGGGLDVYPAAGQPILDLRQWKRPRTRQG